MSAKISNLGNEILQNIGGEENIISFENCMTRLRISLKDDSLLNKAKLEKVEGVMGVVKSGQEVQVIVGPGTASKVSNYVKENTSIKVTDNPEFGQADEMKKQVKDQYKAPGSGF